MEGFIYSLSDPRNDEIRYVGQTTYPLEKRYKEHIRNAKYSKTKNHSVYRWINELIDVGLLPMISLLDTCEIESLNDKEIYWIGKYFGKNLTNMTKGGDGIAFIVKKPFTDKHRESIGNSCRGDKHYRYNKPAFNIKRVCAFNANTGEYYKTYDSIKLASIDTAVSTTAIHFCLNGSRNSSGGRIWIYESQLNEGLVELRRKNYQENPPNEIKRIGIRKITVETNEIVATYKSIREAARENNTSDVAIIYACNKSLTHIYKKFKWESYEK
jgi:hypothetical protein